MLRVHDGVASKGRVAQIETLRFGLPFELLTHMRQKFVVGKTKAVDVFRPGISEELNQTAFGQHALNI